MSTEITKPDNIAFGNINSLAGTINSLSGIVNNLGAGSGIYTDIGKPNAPTYESADGMLWSVNYSPWLLSSYPWLKSGKQIPTYIEVTKP